MHLLCHVVVIAYICQQTLGFLNRGSGCDRDCNHGSCHYGSFGVKYCRCNSGYTGDRCQTRDVCDLNCNGHGSCHSSEGGYKYCQCNSGYTGSRCETRGACRSYTCKHYGRCQNIDTSPYFKCTCNFGYLGDTCEQDHCVSSPCQNGGNCHRTYQAKFYYCTCHNGFSGENCEVAPASHSRSTVPSSSTKVPATTTVTVPNIKQTCSKLSSVFDIAEKVIETNQAAAVCQSGNHTSPEAFVLNNCAVTSATTWRQGYNVMTWCRNIPPYTPIASFRQGKYDSATSVSGIFIGCLQGSQGFTFAVQNCDDAAFIDHIVVGSDIFNRNPNSFFTIEL